MTDAAEGDQLPHPDSPAAMVETPPKTMTEEERLLAEAAYAAVQAFSTQTDRARQAQDMILGVSDVGFCSERVRRTLDGQIPEETDMLAAFHGTAIGDYVERAYKAAFPRAIIQSEVEVTLKGDTITYTLTGHPDIVDPSGLVIDVKTDRGLDIVRRQGPNP